MITHGTPPAANGGWSEFIKDFGIGFLVKGAALRCPANKWRTACYHFATQLPNIGRDQKVAGGEGDVLKPNKINSIGISRTTSRDTTKRTANRVLRFNSGRGLH
jgi:hypothetical protein